MDDEHVRQALAQGQTIDITTIGRKTGQPRRIEIWFHNFDGRVFITGRPGHRDWYANLRTHPNFTFHLKHDVRADLPARAVLIEESEAKRALIERVFQVPGWSGELETWVAHSPLIEVIFDGSATA